jgi:hypothetical protein
MLLDAYLVAAVIYAVTITVLALASILVRTPSRRRDARATLQIMLHFKSEDDQS